MSNLGYVLSRIEAGDRVVFGRDGYGQPWVELWRGRLFQRCARIDCTPVEITCIKRALLSRDQAAIATA